MAWIWAGVFAELISAAVARTREELRQCVCFNELSSSPHVQMMF